jgi:hypothetical protein
MTNSEPEFLPFRFARPASLEHDLRPEFDHAV